MSSWEKCLFGAFNLFQSVGWLLFFVVLSCMSFLDILDTNLFSERRFANIFSRLQFSSRSLVACVLCRAGPFQFDAVLRVYLCSMAFVFDGLCVWFHIISETHVKELASRSPPGPTVSGLTFECVFGGAAKWHPGLRREAAPADWPSAGGDSSSLSTEIPRAASTVSSCWGQGAQEEARGWGTAGSIWFRAGF